MTVGNEWELHNRLRKARRLVDVLTEVLDRNPSLTVDALAARATGETRRLAAEAAGVRPPSDETWQWTIELLRERRG